MSVDMTIFANQFRCYLQQKRGANEVRDKATCNEIAWKYYRIAGEHFSGDSVEHSESEYRKFFAWLGEKEKYFVSDLRQFRDLCLKYWPKSNPRAEVDPVFVRHLNTIAVICQNLSYQLHGTEGAVVLTRMYNLCVGDSGFARHHYAGLPSEKCHIKLTERLQQAGMTAEISQMIDTQWEKDRILEQEIVRERREGRINFRKMMARIAESMSMDETVKQSNEQENQRRREVLNQVKAELSEEVT